MIMHRPLLWSNSWSDRWIRTYLSAKTGYVQWRTYHIEMGFQQTMCNIFQFSLVCHRKIHFNILLIPQKSHEWSIKSRRVIILTALSKTFCRPSHTIQWECLQLRHISKSCVIFKQLSKSHCQPGHFFIVELTLLLLLHIYLFYMNVC